jgi:quercetin dioxygenase-like cupin family protein
MSDQQFTTFEWAPGMQTEPVVQPEKWEFHGEDSVFIKQIFLAKAGYTVPGHAHTYDHTSMLASGKVRMWREGVLVGDFEAPTGLKVEANCFHQFTALVDGTILYCIHNTHGFPADQLEAELVEAYNTEGMRHETSESTS